MTPKEIAASYDDIAEYWVGEEFPVCNGIEQHKKAIAFSSNKGTALDIGCGSSGRIVDLLLESGYSVEGIDISSKMIDLARDRSPKATFECADICEWRFSKKYDFVSAWDSIWHLNLEWQKKVLQKVSEGLNAGGIFIFTTGGVDKPTEHSDSFLGKKLFYGVLGIPKLLPLMQSCGLIVRHLEYDQFPERHLYVIAQKSVT